MVGPADRVQSAEGGGPSQCDQAAWGLHRQGGAHPAHHGVRRARQSPLLPPPVQGNCQDLLRPDRGRIPEEGRGQHHTRPHQQGPPLLLLAGGTWNGVPQQKEGFCVTLIRSK